ncbi:MAG: transposase [bacterium]
MVFERSVIWNHKGRRTEVLDKYYKGMGANACEKIESVALDGARSYIGSTRKNGVNAVVVYDKFHVIQKLNGTVDMVRKRELRKARKEENTDLIELTNCKQRHISVCG